MNRDADAFHRIADERRSVRAFLPEPIPREVLDRCLDSARKAPSSSNLQPWEFVVITDAQERREANAAARGCQSSQTCHRSHGRLDEPRGGTIFLARAPC